MRPIVVTRKHYVQSSLFAVASGAILNIQLVEAVAAPVVTVASEVQEGCRISAIYIEMWLSSDDAGSGSVIVTVEKAPGIGASPNMSTADAADLTQYDNKKNVLFTQMGLLPSNVQYPMAVIKGWIKIPKSKQRFGLDDRIMLNIFGQSNGVSGCGFSIFKEQT